MLAAMSSFPSPFGSEEQNLEPSPSPPPAATNRQSLPFQRLMPYELVKDQYQEWGITFEGAIALPPSNPSFYNRTSEIVLMPLSGRRSITLTLKNPPPRITVQVRGYRDIQLSALDHSGHCITHCKTFRFRYAEHHKAPLEELTVENRHTHGLILESSAPFVLESVCF